MSSELHFLPHLLNINDTQNNARKGSGGARDVISGCRGTNLGAWTQAWPEKKVHFKGLNLSLSFVIWTRLWMLWFHIKEVFHTKTLEFMNLNDFSPLQILYTCSIDIIIAHEVFGISPWYCLWSVSARTFFWNGNGICKLGHSTSSTRFCSKWLRTDFTNEICHKSCGHRGRRHPQPQSLCHNNGECQEDAIVEMVLIQRVHVWACSLKAWAPSLHL